MNRRRLLELAGIDNVRAGRNSSQPILPGTPYTVKGHPNNTVGQGGFLVKVTHGDGQLIHELHKHIYLYQMGEVMDMGEDERSEMYWLVFRPSTDAGRIEETLNHLLGSSIVVEFLDDDDN